MSLKAISPELLESSTVLSLNGLIGNLSLTSTGGSILITPSGTSINLESTSGGTGTVTNVSGTNANGVGFTITNPTTTPDITIALTNITPTTVNALTLTAQPMGFTIAGGASSKTLTVPDNATVSGTNTGDQTITLTGDVTGSGTGSFVTAIAAGVIVNNDINASAAIAVSKLAALTTGRAVVTDGSGFISVATTTATEIGFVNGVTSAIQTQLNGKQASGNYITALTGDVTAAGPGSSAATLATVNSNVGSFSYANVTVNAKGLVTAASNGTTPATASFTTISVAGQSDVVADSATDTLTLVAGSNITITTNAGTDTITFAAGGSGSSAFNDITSGTNTTATMVVGSGASLATSGSGTIAATTATTATNVTVANEATDTTCFPLFATAATGDLPPKSNAGYTYNSNTNALSVTTLGGTLSTTAQPNITSVGTLTGGATGSGFTIALSTSTITGTLAATNGGTAQSTYATGDILYASATNTLSKLTGNITTGKQYLSQTGSGAASAAPVWAAVAGADVTGAALTKTDDTNVTLTLGGTPTTALLRSASLTLGWTGTLAVTRGGTGLGTVAQGDILYGSASNTLSALTKDANATRYLSNTGASNNPAWSQINLANGVSGDLPFANLTQIAGLSVLAVTGASTADVAGITGTANQVLRVNGAATTLAFGSIDLAQSATVGASILTVPNGGTGLASTTAYSVICGGTTTTGALQNVSGVGSSGQVLTSNGAAALPTWQAASGSSSAVTKAITQTTHGFSVGNVIRLNGTSTYAKAQSDSSADAEVVGIVSAVAGANDFTVTTSGYVTGLSGLTANTLYFLDPSSAGALTATEPTTVGQVSKPVFYSDTTTSGYFINYRGMLISANDTIVNVSGTVTPSGTTGAQVINKPSGSVNFATGASSLVVTNSIVTANSLVFVSINTNDATLNYVWAVPTSGSFTIFGNTIATAETKVRFLVVNTI